LTLFEFVEEKLKAILETIADVAYGFADLTIDGQKFQVPFSSDKADMLREKQAHAAVGQYSGNASLQAHAKLYEEYFHGLQRLLGRMGFLDSVNFTWKPSPGKIVVEFERKQEGGESKKRKAEVTEVVTQSLQSPTELNKNDPLL
jgi:hypothetical protein